MNLNVLILDDNPDRHIVVKSVLIKELNLPEAAFAWFHAYTYSKALSFIKTKKLEGTTFNIMCLDHDLAEHDPLIATRNFSDGCSYDGFNFYTGADFCCNLVNENQCPNYVWIHTWNLPGARHMKNILEKAINKPTVLVEPIKK